MHSRPICDVLLGSFEAAFHAADDADRPISGTNKKLSRRQEHEAGDALAESVLVRTYKLKRV